MSNDLNQCNFIGRFGKKPECRYMPNGDAVTSGSIAVGRYWRDKQTGERKEATTWVPVNFYGKLAEIVSEFCDKGSRVFISGEFSVRKWQDKQTGADKYSTEIKANTMQMLDSRNGGAQNEMGSSQAASANGIGHGHRGDTLGQSSGTANYDFDSDIPF